MDISKAFDSVSHTHLLAVTSLAGTNWGFDTETLVSTYKLIWPVLNNGALIWYAFAFASTLTKIETVHNAALQVATGNLMMAPITHLHSETKVHPMSTHLKQFYASAHQTVQCASQSRSPGETPEILTSYQFLL